MLPPEKLLEASDQTARILAHARLIKRLDERLLASLPAGLAGHARVVNYRLGSIVIHATNGAVAAKLKQLAPRLCDSFVKIGLECKQMEVKVQPLQSIQQSSTSTIKPISAAGRSSLEECAGRMPSTSPLAQALRQLLARAATRE